MTRLDTRLPYAKDAQIRREDVLFLYDRHWQLWSDGDFAVWAISPQGQRHSLSGAIRESRAAFNQKQGVGDRGSFSE